MLIRNYLCLLAFFALFSPVMAQENGIIHLQTENNMPYKANWNGNTYVSSSTGYLVIPQVSRGPQTVSIAFSPGVSSDYSFDLLMGDQPLGYSLRLAVDNSWGLFNLVNAGFTKGAAVAKLAGRKPVEVFDTLTDAKPEIIPVAIEAPVIKMPSQLTRPTGIQKIFDKTGNTGIDQVYIILNGSRTDTIALFIPVLTETEAKPAGTNPSSLISSPGKKSGADPAVHLLFTAGINTRRLLSK